MACNPDHDLKFWRSRVVHEDKGCVVANKPPGLQVPPTVDNVRESLLAKIEEVSQFLPGKMEEERIFHL